MTSMFDHDDIEIEVDIPPMRGKVRKGRWFSEAGLRARDKAIMVATLAVIYPDDNGFVDDTIFDAIIAAAAEPEVPS